MTQENVKERVQEGVETGEAVADPVAEVEGALEVARVLREQQGHETVTPHQVVWPKDHDEDDSDDDEGPHDSATLVVGDRRGVAQGDPDPGRGESARGRQ